MIKKMLSFFILLFAGITGNTAMAETVDTLRIATFNVSMEALNYTPRDRKLNNDELEKALASNHSQIRNIAEIIQRINPDIILLNEFDRTDESANLLKQFISDYLNQSQNGQTPIDYPYFYQGPVNTGVKFPVDINGDGKIEHPQDTYGFGFFPGHFGMALLSKYPIDSENIRTFQKFLWKDMPNALLPNDPVTGKRYYSENVLNHFRLSSKSHWDIPVLVDGKSIHILAAHPTPPVFDGPEDRNGKRNHDEIRLLSDYVANEQANYIYDDNGQKGGLATEHRFVVLGDLNASTTDGDAVREGIAGLLSNLLVVDPMPESIGGKENRAENVNGKHHTAHWGMRADYVLPSTFGWRVTGSGVFWPNKSSPLFRLIENRSASSDHRLVWVDLKFN